MGLDMYLTRKKLFYPVTDGKMTFAVEGVDVPLDNVHSVALVINIGSWRKANAIHGWFVEHVQGGADDQRQYHVEFEQLEELLNLCRLVKDNPSLAPQMLPTHAGFMFGDTGYDDSYFYNLDRTIGLLEEALSDRESSVYYDAWW